MLRESLSAMAMDDSLEVFFCDLCNTSVPLRDLEIGAASRFKGRVIGGCCLSDLRGSGRARGGAPGNPRAASLAVTILVLIAVAAATIFLDRRLSDETDGLAARLGGLKGAGDRHEARLAALEGRFEAVPARADVQALGGQLDTLETAVREGGKGVDVRLGALGEQARLVGREVEEVRRTQREHGAGLTGLEREVRLLGAEVAALRALPRATPTARVDAPPPVEAAPPGPAPIGLAPELAHELTRLKDPDAGIRFEAVDKLIASRQLAVLEHVLAMVKDDDAFVRRLTVDGLQHFRHRAAVEALLEALMDPEELVRHYANTSLQGLTGQKIAYDPEGGRDQRSQGQRRWREWWDKNRGSF
jgi:hypothetical protein